MSHSAIEDLVHRYADGVVRRDEKQWAATWAEDGEWVLSFDHRVQGLHAIVELWREAMGTLDAVVQTVLNGTVEIHEAGWSGVGRWYIQEHARTTRGRATLMLAHYDDRYVRIDGGWRFARRRLVAHYHGPPDLSGEFSIAEEA